MEHLALPLCLPTKESILEPVQNFKFAFIGHALCLALEPGVAVGGMG